MRVRAAVAAPLTVKAGSSSTVPALERRGRADHVKSIHAVVIMSPEVPAANMAALEGNQVDGIPRRSDER
jgi:hypothetical protein